MTRSTRLNLLVAIVSVVLALVVSEIVVRSVGSRDQDGNFWVGGRRLRPYRLPRASVEKALERYHEMFTHFEYDPDLGWSPRPGSSSVSGLSRFNSQGIRSDVERYAPAPPEGTLRVGLFGDSFTEGKDVSLRESWGYRVQEHLGLAGIPAEVLNFGTSGYGMDQAFLRWRKHGRALSPDIVVFGFQPENLKRNVNVLRPLYWPGAGIPFSKPRFVPEAGGLELVNVPTLPVDRILPTLEALESWGPVKHEYYYRGEDYRRQPWLRSRLVSLGLSAFAGDLHSRPEEEVYRIDGEPGRLALSILDAFATEVENDGARFLVVHLPLQHHLEGMIRGRPLPYGDVLDRIAADHDLVDPAPALLEEASRSSVEALFIDHYSAAGNAVIASVTARHLSDAGTR